MTYKLELGIEDKIRLRNIAEHFSLEDADDAIKKAILIVNHIVETIRNDGQVTFDIGGVMTRKG